MITGGSILQYQGEVYFMIFPRISWILCIGYLEHRNRHLCSPLTRGSCTMHPILQWYRSHLQMIFTLMAYGILMSQKQLRVTLAKLLVTKEPYGLVFSVLAQ